MQRAIVLTDHSTPAKVQEVPIPQADAGSVVIEVYALYLADYLRHVWNGSLGYPLHFPMTPGGSCVGRITATGPDTTTLKPGQLVITDAMITARDNPSAQFLLGLHMGATPAAQALSSKEWRNGSMAQYVKMPLENVYALDEDALLGRHGYSINELPLLQTIMIPYGGLADAGVQAGDTVVVAPATGNFGGAAVLAALSMGAKVVACGRSRNALDTLVGAMGDTYGGRLATVAWAGEPEKDTELLKQAVGAYGADVYIDFSPPAAGANGTPAHMLHGVAALKNGGKAVFMGGLTGNVELPHMLLMFNNIYVMGNFMYTPAQARQVIKMAEIGLLKLGRQVGQKVPQTFVLDEIEDALTAAEGAKGWGVNIALVPRTQ